MLSVLCVGVCSGERVKDVGGMKLRMNNGERETFRRRVRLRNNMPMGG